MQNDSNEAACYPRCNIFGSLWSYPKIEHPPSQQSVFAAEFAEKVNIHTGENSAKQKLHVDEREACEFDAAVVVVAHWQSAAEIRAARAYFCWQRGTQSSRDYIEKGLFTLGRSGECIE
jgi:hypothetical protein